MLAEFYNASLYKSISPEIDGLLVLDNRIIMVIEVKYGEISRGEVLRFIDKINHLNCRKLIIAKTSLKK